MYKIVTIEDYEANYKDSHPAAVKSSDNKEVVLSNEGNMTKEQVKKHMLDNWPQNDAP